MISCYVSHKAVIKTKNSITVHYHSRKNNICSSETKLRLMTVHISFSLRGQQGTRLGFSSVSDAL